MSLATDLQSGRYDLGGAEREVAPPVELPNDCPDRHGKMIRTLGSWVCRQCGYQPGDENGQ